MASCVGLGSAAGPGKLLAKASYLSLQRQLTKLQLPPASFASSQTQARAATPVSFLHKGFYTKGTDWFSFQLRLTGGPPRHPRTSLKASLHTEASAPPTRNPSNDVTTPEEPHIPVLLNEVVEQFAGRKLAVYADGTVGAAGHACAIIAAHPELETFVGLDVDPRAHAEAKQKLDTIMEERSAKGQAFNVHLIKSNFENMHSALRSLEGGFALGGVDGMLLDLGVSSMQVDEAERGFSFLRDGPLDMRMNPAAAVTAEQIVNDWPEDRLGKIIRDYGEERYWRAIARRIADARTVSRIRTTGQLVDVVGRPRPGRRKGGAAKGIHPATRTFQALRIAVNDELGVLERGLPRAIECLAPGGRLAVISFHSLEDRIVKRAFLAAAGRPYVDEEDEIAYNNLSMYHDKEAPKAVVKILTRKPVITSEEEAKANSRSRSAKLRVVEKLRL